MRNRLLEMYPLEGDLSSARLQLDSFETVDLSAPVVSRRRAETLNIHQVAL